MVGFHRKKKTFVFIIKQSHLFMLFFPKEKKHIAMQGLWKYGTEVCDVWLSIIRFSIFELYGEETLFCFSLFLSLLSFPLLSIPLLLLSFSLSLPIFIYIYIFPLSYVYIYSINYKLRGGNSLSLACFRGQRQLFGILLEIKKIICFHTKTVLVICQIESLNINC